jgi:HD-like signal output (HDOD) protein
VRHLACELNTGEVRLPSFPDVALRVQRVLEDPRTTAAQIAQLLGSDAALAARVLRIANTVTFNLAGKPITDLRAAIRRLGHDLVRSAAVSFASGSRRRRAATRCCGRSCASCGGRARWSRRSPA